jgi:hypothetical protein
MIYLAKGAPPPLLFRAPAPDAPVQAAQVRLCALDAARRGQRQRQRRRRHWRRAERLAQAQAETLLGRRGTRERSIYSAPVGFYSALVKM